MSDQQQAVQLYRVLRPLNAGGAQPIAAGQIIDGSTWPVYRIPRLIEQRFIVPVEVIAAMPGSKPAQGAKTHGN